MTEHNPGDARCCGWPRSILIAHVYAREVGDEKARVCAPHGENLQHAPLDLTALDPVWVDVLKPTGEDSAWLERMFGFQPLALEDVAARRQRPKLDEYTPAELGRGAVPPGHRADRQSWTTIRRRARERDELRTAHDRNQSSYAGSPDRIQDRIQDRLTCLHSRLRHVWPTRARGTLFGAQREVRLEAEVE